MFGRRKFKRAKGESDNANMAEAREAPPAHLTTEAALAAGDVPQNGGEDEFPESHLDPKSAEQPLMPPLYRQPTPLSSDAHGTWHLARKRNFGFTAEAPLIPLNVAEFPLASRHYPIVFSAQGPMALAVLGTSGANALVDQQGVWKEGAYVPAYIRRYPFLFINAPDDRYVLSIDAAYRGFGESGDPLFVDGRPSDLTKNALAFCQVFERELEATTAFIHAITDAGVLSQDQPRFSRPSRRTLTVKGVRVIEQAAYDALPDAVVGNWRQQGWLPAVYAHLSSLANWELIGA